MHVNIVQPLACITAFVEHQFGHSRSVSTNVLARKFSACYNHCVCPSVHYHMHKPLEPHGIFQSLNAYDCSDCLTIGMHNNIFLMDEVLLSFGLVLGQLVKMFITLEPLVCKTVTRF